MAGSSRYADFMNNNCINDQIRPLSDSGSVKTSGRQASRDTQTRIRFVYTDNPLADNTDPRAEEVNLALADDDRTLADDDVVEGTNSLADVCVPRAEDQ